YRVNHGWGNYDRKFNTKQSTELELQYELKKRNLRSKDVTYAVCAANGNIYIDTYKDNITSPM
ncbi:hypothetical protein P9X10_33690, partial [Bacillus cereus]|nr:hypothetical protein [Bacillus cereus]